MIATQTPLFFKTSTVVTFDAQKSNTGSSHRALSIGWGGAYSSRKSLAPWRGQCHQPWVGVPPLRSASLTSWVAPPTKRVQGVRMYQLGNISSRMITEVKQHWTYYFFSILLTHEGSHREAYRDFQPSLTSSAGPVPRVVQTTGSVHLQPILPNCQLCINTEPTTSIGRLIKSSRL